MKVFFVVIIVFFFSSSIHAQQKRPEGTLHGQGTILLSSGKMLNGTIRYNTRKGVLHYKSDNETGTFAPRNISRFSFYDTALCHTRRFYSLEYEDIDNGCKRYYFFEVLNELPHFAVLAKMDPIELKSNHYFLALAGTIGFPTSSIGSRHKPVQYRKQDETVYIVDRSGAIKPYLETKYIYKNNKTYVKTRVVQKDLLTRCFGKAAEALRKFSIENKLSFEKKDDLLKIVAHYKVLANGESRY